MGVGRSCIAIGFALGAMSIMVGASCSLRDISDLGPSRGDKADAFAPTADAGSNADAEAVLDGSMESPYVKEVLVDEPVAYLRLGETTGTIAHARRGSIAATYSLAGVELGKPGAIARDNDTAITLSGGHIVLDGDLAFSGQAPYTIEVWVKAASTMPGFGYLVDHQTYDGARSGWLLRTAPVLALERWSNGDGNGYDGPTLSPGVWHHVVGMYDGERYYFFVDTLPTAPQVATVTIPAVPGSTKVGDQNCDCTGNAYLGELDELAIYNKPLSEARIRAHFQAAQ